MKTTKKREKDEKRENDEKSENDEEDEFMEDVSKPYSSKDVPLFRIDPMKMIRNKGEYKKIKQKYLNIRFKATNSHTFEDMGIRFK